MYSAFWNVICIYLTKCGFGQKMYYLANCVMSVCCCVKSLEKSTLSIGKRLLAIEEKL